MTRNGNLTYGLSLGTYGETGEIQLPFPLDRERGGRGQKRRSHGSPGARRDALRG